MPMLALLGFGGNSFEGYANAAVTGAALMRLAPKT